MQLFPSATKPTWGAKISLNCNTKFSPIARRHDVRRSALCQRRNVVAQRRDVITQRRHRRCRRHRFGFGFRFFRSLRPRRWRSFHRSTVLEIRIAGL